MFTYLIIDIVFMSLAGLTIAIFRTKLQFKKLLIVALLLIILTALFDNALISLHFYSYNPHRIIGWYVGRVPIEDFAYTIVAAAFIPWLWEKLK